MMKFTALHDSKSEKLIRDIIKNEDLQVTTEESTNALGDSIITVSGSKEDITILKEIYRMVR